MVRITRTPMIVLSLLAFALTALLATPVFAEEKADEAKSNATEKAKPEAKNADKAKDEKKLSLEEITKRMDKTISGYDDQVMEVEMRIYDNNGNTSSYDFDVWQKGEETRLLRFKSGEIKGMAMLIQDRNNVWVYLPGYKRVRRVSASNMRQSIAGSDFTNDDMAAGSWSAAWDMTLKDQDEDAWYIHAVPKPGEDTEYASALIKVDKKTFHQLYVKYYNKDGEFIKYYHNEKLKDFGKGLNRHSLVVMEDPRTGHKTELHVKSMKVNVGLKDSMFTKRTLQWGR